jgi:4-amino-4-deoxy-L-arabinose transferase-like glycosyltransferase
VFGSSEPATHALSLLIAIAVVPVAFWAAARLFDRRAAWFSAVFASLSPFLTYFAGETRMYSLVVLESILVCVTFSMAFIERRPRGPWWFAASLAALVYTHYWGFYAAVGAALACLFLAATSREVRPLARAGLIGFGVAAAAFIPWLPTFAQQIRSTGAPWSHTPTVRGVVGELAALVRDERVLIAVVLGVSVGLASLVADAYRSRWSVHSADLQKAVAALFIGATPVAIGWVLAHLEPSWATRYLAVAVGPMILLVGLGLARARWVGVAAMAVIALLVTQPFTRISPGLGIAKDSKSNAGSIAALVQPALPSGSLVLASQPEAVPLFAHYLGAGYLYADPRGVVDDPQVMDWRDAEAAMEASSVPGRLAGTIAGLHPGDRVLFLTTDSPPKDTDTAWIERIRERGQQWHQYLASTCLQPVMRSGRTSGPSDTPYLATLYQCR